MLRIGLFGTACRVGYTSQLQTRTNRRAVTYSFAFKFSNLRAMDVGRSSARKLLATSVTWQRGVYKFLDLKARQLSTIGR